MSLAPDKMMQNRIARHEAWKSRESPLIHMPILDSKTLPHTGPYIEMAALPLPVELDEHGWPERSFYQKHVFFEWGDTLSDMLCAVTRSYLFFDQYEFTLLTRPVAIHLFTAKVLTTASRVASCPAHYFDKETPIYRDSIVPESCRSGLHLKGDLIQTLLFIVERSTAAATEGKYLAIIGI